MNLMDMDSAQYGVLLGADVARCAAPEEDVQRLSPDTEKRLLFIGLGGSGIKTLDRIKKYTAERMQPHTRRYAAFLAVDTDYHELECTTHLERNELLCITAPGVTQVATSPCDTWNKAWHFAAPEQDDRNIAYWSGNGVNSRLHAKLKLYSQPLGAMGMDEELVRKLALLRAEELDPVYGNQQYEIYVIAGLSGGTGSGLITEMPGLLRQIFRPGEASIHALVYLPDTIEAWNPMNKAAMEANGYAAMKELDYYQSRAGKAGETAVFPYNGSPDGKVTLDLADGYYTSICLVGSQNGSELCADQAARSVVVEHLTAILSGGVDASCVESGDVLAHMPRTPMFYYRGYMTLGAAVADLPRDQIWAQSVGQLMQKSGLLPVSDKMRAVMLANGAKSLPFRGEDQFDMPQVLDQERTELLKPLSMFMRAYQSQSFRYEMVAGKLPTWQEIADGSAEMEVSGARRMIRNRAVGVEARMSLERKTQEQFRMFRDAVKEYVKRHGPMAFWNLYNGHAKPAEGQSAAVGIGEALKFMVDDCDPATGKPCVWPETKKCKQELEAVRSELADVCSRPLRCLRIAISGRRQELVNRWVEAYDRMVNAEINEMRRGDMLGRNGILDQYFRQPAEKLARQIYTFGKVLETLGQIYQTNGAMLNDYEALQDWTAETGQGTVVAADAIAYGYVKKDLDDLAMMVDPEKLRSNLVDSFFDDPAAWLQVDDHEVRCMGNQIRLVNEPLNVRKRFERCMMEQTGARWAHLSVRDVFENLHGDTTAAMRRIAEELTRRCKPMCNGRYTPAGGRLLLPTSLQGVPEAYHTLLNEFRQIEFHDAARALSAEDAYAIRLLRTYKVRLSDLRELPRWEESYRRKLGKIGNGLHGLSQAQLGAENPGEGALWSELPNLTAG